VAPDDDWAVLEGHELKDVADVRGLARHPINPRVPPAHLSPLRELGQTRQRRQAFRTKGGADCLKLCDVRRVGVVVAQKLHSSPKTFVARSWRAVVSVWSLRTT
jgi:hypothetical protein